MNIVLAIAAAVLFGCSDFLAARSGRDNNVLSVTRTVVLTTVVLSPLLLFVEPGRFITRDIVIGLLSGLTMILGLLLLYRGYTSASIGTVAPISSVLVGAVPVIFDLVAGRRPSTIASIGIVIGLTAVALTSYQPSSGDAAHTATRNRGFVFGVTSGLLFGISFALMGECSDASGLQPIIAQRASGFVLLLMFGVWEKAPWLVRSRPGLTYALVAGLFAIAGMSTLQLAFRGDASGPVAVAASQFATAAVIMAVIFDRERLRWWQAVGVLATAIGVAFMALG